MPPDALVSVVMPVHDAAPYIGEAIDSVLAQTHPDVEVVVVDDGSSDGSGEIARAYGDPVRMVRQEHHGEAAARNRAVELARGSHIGFLDADDIWVDRKLELQLAALADPEVELVFGHQHQFRSPELARDAGRFAGEDETVPSLLAGTLLVSSADFDRVGGYRDFKIAPTMDWLLRARDLGLRERMLDDVVLRRRLHPAGHSIRDRDKFGDYARMLKASLDRRRASG